MHSSSDDNGAITGINVTPLVDIILVVLIIFMATAPMISNRKLPVDLPKAKQTDKAGTEAYEVAFTAKRELFFRGKAVTQDALIVQLLAAPDRAVILAADKAVPYGEVVALLDAIRGAGVKRIGLQVKTR